MNFAALQGLSSTGGSGAASAKTGLTSNKYGDVFTLTSKGITFANMRVKEGNCDPNELCGTLTLNGVTLPSLLDVEALTVNEDGSVLLVQSKTRLLAIEIPADNYVEGYLQSNPKNVVAYELLSPSDCRGEYYIVKASFHPLNGLAVLVLQGAKSFSVFDLRTKDKQTILLQLPQHVRLTSFVCGPNVEWLRFSIFLSTEDGYLYTLCPIIPPGTVLSLAILEELWLWIDDQRSLWTGSLNQEDKLRWNYVELLEAYLQDLFGDIQTLLDQHGEGESLQDVVVVAEPGQSRVSSDLPLSRRRHTIALRNFFIAAQGPLSIITPAAHPASRECITDLCIPRGESLSESAPVLATVTSTGRVEIILVELLDERAGYVSPWFQSIDPRETLFTPPFPSLLLADSFQPSVSTSSSARWTISPDPVHGHFFYATCPTDGHAFLISSSWLRDSLHKVQIWQEDLASVSVESKSGPGSEERDGDWKSLCLPLYERNEGESIRALSVTYDVIAGHVALLLLSSGLLLAVNVSVHTKLCELYAQDSAKQQLNQGALARQLHAATKDAQLRFKVSQKLIQLVAKGLTTFPKLDVGVESEKEAVSGQKHPRMDEGKKHLIAVAHQLETSVLQPLEELHQHTLFHAELVRQLYDAQRLLLHGKGGGSGGDSAKEAFAARGVHGLLANLTQGQEILNERLDNVREREQVIRQRIARCMHLLAHLPKKETREQKLYHQQMVVWVESVQRLNRELESLKLYFRERQSQELAQQQAAEAHPTTDRTLFTSPVRGMGSKVGRLSAGASPLFATPTHPRIVSHSPSTTTASTFSNRAALAVASLSSGGGGDHSAVARSPFLTSPQSTPRRPTFTSTGDRSRAMSTAGPDALRLSAEEIAACEELLESLGRTLEEKKELVRRLEKDLHEVKLAQQGSNRGSPRRR